MRIARFFKLILIIIECLTFFVAITVIRRSINQAGLSGITLMASAALFLLMAVFIWLDSERYRVYMPLFMTGKFIGVFFLLCFPVISGQDRKNDILSGDVNFVTFLLFSYIFSLAVVIFIIFREKKPDGVNQNDENKLEVV